MKKVFTLILLMCCLLCAVAHADVYICEAVSKNLTLHPDPQGEAHDYVILANDGPSAISLAGMKLCDEEGKAYSLPDRELAPGEMVEVRITDAFDYDLTGELI